MMLFFKKLDSFTVCGEEYSIGSLREIFEKILEILNEENFSQKIENFISLLNEKKITQLLKKRLIL